MTEFNAPVSRVDQQSQESVESFGWQWSCRSVWDTTRFLHRRLFLAQGIWPEQLRGKVVADVGSGTGRNAWALERLTDAKEIISVELANKAVSRQRVLFEGKPRVRVLEGDAASVEFAADFIYLVGVIQHTADPLLVLDRAIRNLRMGGELVVSFYMRTPATVVLEPFRWVLSRLPKVMLWFLSPLLAPIFMFRQAGREGGIRNAQMTAYDYFGSHHYQHYFTERQILSMFAAVGIDATNVIRLSKGRYRVRKAVPAKGVQDTLIAFGAPL